MKNGFGVSRGNLAAAFVLAAAVLFGAAGSARAAGGINLAWGDCSVAGTVAKTMSCNCNGLTGAIMIASAIAGVDMPELNGEESVIDIQTNQTILSPWWHVEVGGCRTTGLSVGFDFTGGPFTCLDPWQGLASGSFTYFAGYGGPNRAQLRSSCAIAESTAITGTDEYYLFKVTLLGAKTCGTGSCAGCTDGVCIVFNSLKLTQAANAPGGDVTVNNPLIRNYVLFQTGGASLGCPGATRTRQSTWGSVKTLYRSSAIPAS